jgi:hypothetical protein
MRQTAVITLEVEETIIVDRLSLSEMQICPVCQQRITQTFIQAQAALTAADETGLYEKGDKDDVEDGK